MDSGHPARAPRFRLSAETLQGLSWRALVIATVLTIAGGLWVRQSEIAVAASQVSEAVPAIPAIAAVLLVLIANWAIRRTRRGAGLTQAEVLAVYTFVSIAVSMVGIGVIRYWLASVIAPFHFGAIDPRLAALQRHIPWWLAPHDPSVTEGIYRGRPGGIVPWGNWLVPLAAWSGFFVTFWFGLLCTMVLVRQRWLEEERLTYPIAELMLEMTAPPGDRGASRPFFRNPVMWIGFGVAFCYNAVNILHAFHPAVPSLPLAVNVLPPGVAPPWKALGALPAVFAPMLLGLGFLVSAEISLSIWVACLLSLGEGVLVSWRGYSLAGQPFTQEQSMGAFLFLGLGLLWAVRGTVKQVLRAGFGRPATGAPPGDPMPHQWAVFGLIASSVGVLYFFHAAGMAWWVSGFYLAMLGLVALGCARVRAETGLPLVWAFPFWMQKKVMLYTLGSAAFTGGAFPGTLTVLALLGFLSRGYFPALVGYQADGFKLADRSRMHPRAMAVIIMLALIVGLGVAFYVHLAAYYRIGAGHLLQGIWGETLAKLDYTDAITASQVASHPDVHRIAATGFGFALMAVTTYLRRTQMWFPFHPIGFAVATSYAPLLWFPFFCVWLTKVVILRWGGMRLYRGVMPGFLGFAVGHLLMAGMVWGLTAAACPAVAPGYSVFFG